MNEPQSFLPSLDNMDGGVITDPATVISKIIGFILMNPGDTTDLNDSLRGSIGPIVAAHYENPAIMANEFQKVLATHINNQLGENVYDVNVDVAPIEESTTEGRLIIYVTDMHGDPVLTKDLILEEIVGKLYE